MITKHFTASKETCCVGMNTIAYSIDRLEFADNILVHTAKSVIEVYGDKQLRDEIIQFLNQRENPECNV